MEKGDFCISTIASSHVAVLLTIGVITIHVVRISYVIYRSSKPLHSKSSRSLSTLIVLGSGGHTAEMLNLLYVLQTRRFKRRYYVAAATDNMSLQKAHVFEDSLLGKEALEEAGGAEFMQIYRSREVGQSYITSVRTTLVAIAHALWLMIKIRPQVILCNGPGTCIPLCVIEFLFKSLELWNPPLMLVLGKLPTSHTPRDADISLTWNQPSITCMLRWVLDGIMLSTSLWFIVQS
ncbi:hypothetical protein BC332_03572 [Capsicum chinense]|nr:hypothetical protein BC332_03572 [Capsicum chinense]